MASLNQIEAGLIAEAQLQLRMAMGKVKDQQKAITAQNNIKETWQELLAFANVPDRDEPLGEVDPECLVVYEIGGILMDPTSPVVAVILLIYQLENFAYKELNRSSRFKDFSKVQHLGPWAASLHQIIGYA